MTTKELREKYTMEELSSFPGDMELRHKIFSPLFENLYESRMIYHEGGNGWLIQAENITITNEGFEAAAIPICLLYKRPNRSSPNIKSWTFSFTWDWVCLSGDHFSVLYAGYSVCVDEEKIKRIEKLISENRLNETYKVVWEEEIQE